MSSLLSQLGAIGVTLTPVFRLLIDTALKGSILIALAAVAIYFLRGKAAAARHAVWTAAVVGHLALPLMTLVVPAWRIPLLPAPSWIDAPASVRASISAGKESVGVAPISTTPTVDAAPAQDKRVAPAIPSPVNRSPANRSMVERNTVNPSAPSSPLHVAAVLGFLWISGSFLVLLRLAIGTWRVGKLAKNGDRVDDGEWLSLTQRVAKRLGITRPLTLLRGDSLAVPVTWGVVYPAVLLPPDAAEWPEARRRFVLVHEMAHVKRFDALTQLIAQVTIAILWFDPLIWLAAHRMRVEREHACDDYVLRDGTAASLYAGELLEMVQAIGSPRHEHAAPAFAALAMARRSEFEGRMLAILDPRQNRRTLGRASTILASAVLALLVIPLAALRPFESHADSAVASAASAMRRGGISPAVATPAAASSARLARKIGDTACDSVKRLAGVTTSTHIHIDDDDKSDQRIIEFLNSSAGYCSQAVVLGAAKFADDRLAALSAGSFASFRELTSGGDRIVRVIPAYGGQLEYIASFNGRQVPYDDEMRRWMQRFVPEVLRETGVDVPQRVKRDMARGGLSLVLSNIRRTKSTSSKRAHYLA
ncbi:MAG TPA: M56 family metallopeptidase, partial [Gemmatimonadaceae bacterium]|nr:M56 family metallopeptidase [Gemmatimonadaceae bacterium]